MSTAKEEPVGKSIFDHERKDLSQKKLQDLMRKNDFSTLINARERALLLKEEQERKRISNMLANRLISPRTCELEHLELERWVTAEK